MKKVVMYAHSGSKNHGCEAIVRATCKIIDSHDNMYLFSEQEKEDIQFGLDKLCNVAAKNKAFKRRSFYHILSAICYRFFNNVYFYNRKVLDAVDSNTVAMSIGGDNYCYAGYPKVLAALNSSMKKRSAKTVLWGCSIEPKAMDHNMVKDLMRYDLIVTRETITYNALLEKGVTKNTHLIPDPAFLLDKAELPLPEGFKEGNTIGLNVSPLVQSLESGDNITYKNYSALIKHIIDTTDMQIALIPHVTWENNNDLTPLTELYNEYKSTGRVILFGDQYNCMELKGFISRCRMFIGARTHATIAAYSTCVPTLVVGYSVKALGIAKDIFGSDKNMVIPVNSLKHENDLIKAYEFIKEREEDIRKHLSGFIPAYKEKVWLAGDKIKELIQD